MMKMDPDQSGPTDGPATIHFAGGKASLTLVWILAVALLISSGIAYRVLAVGYHGILNDPITLPVPLAQFPRALYGWRGNDVPIQASTLEYMRTHFADDYISRRYVDGTGQWADLYVVYCSSQPGGILGHNPTRCYPGNGWMPVDAESLSRPSQITTRSGHTVECLMHRFSKSSPAYQEIVVLSFYVVNGLISVSERDFSGFWFRTPNIAGDPARYVAQVQVASSSESAARLLARDATDMILGFLPNTSGIVGSEVNTGPQKMKSE
jgi:EpsI family protein